MRVVFMKTFDVKRMPSTSYPYIVFSTSYVNPLDDLDNVERALRTEYKGKVLFDLLLSNGNASNRFVEAMFDGEKFDDNSFHKVENVGDDVLQFSASYYRQSKYLEQSKIVPRAYKFLLNKEKYSRS